MVLPHIHWNRNKWLPTNSSFDKDAVSEKIFGNLKSNLRQQTHLLKHEPYHPRPWIDRASTFMKLGYPDLAVGDLHKARLLIKEGQRCDSPIGAAVFLVVGKETAARCSESHQISSCDKPQSGLNGSAKPTAIGIDGNVRVNIHNKSLSSTIDKLEQEMLEALITALETAGSYGAAYQTCKEAQMRWPDNKTFQIMESRIRKHASKIYENPDVVDLPSSLTVGHLYRRAYPWIPDFMLHRDKKTLEMIRKEFSGPKQTVDVSESKFLNAVLADSRIPSTDLLGMYAKCDVAEDTVIFFDQDVLHATTAPKRCPTCAERLPLEHLRARCPQCSRSFCSDACFMRAALRFHHAMCGRDFSFLQQAAKRALVDSNDDTHFALEPLLLQRMLLTILQPDMTPMLEDFLRQLPEPIVAQLAPNLGTWSPSSPEDHPLASPNVARLTASYTSDIKFGFSYKHHIVNPVRTLQTLGIDPFVNHAYDTWVLETIRHRLCNNRLGGTLSVPTRRGASEHPVMSVHPCYAMLNHSCEANVGVAAGKHGAPALETEGECDQGERGYRRGSSGGDGAMVTVFAMKQIREGDELFVSYIGGEQEMPRKQRQARLRSWFGERGCKCERCEREKSQE